jgi:catechol 2,3-dioxygenase-like lactoylglutathione lyase family enzyme
MPRMKAVLLLLGLSIGCAGKQATRPQPPGRILGIGHMALYVSDLGAARRFYEDFLGFEEAYSLPRPDGGGDRIAFVKVNEEQYLELFAEPPRNDGRVNHIAFYTDDTEALRRNLAGRGVTVPATVGKGKIGNTQFGVVDPDGHNVELLQYQPGGWTVREKGKHLPATRVAARIGHLGVLVGALGKSLAFYQGLLGFEETWRGGPSTTALSWVNLRVPGGPDYLELMLYDQLPAPTERGGKNHICLIVPDVPAAVAVLERRPARKQYGRTIEVKVGVNHKRQANLFDPDGTRVELMEPNTFDRNPVPPSSAPAPHP